jgi:heme/copper-type cytochrome/quinol oxidase subunit 2
MNFIMSLILKELLQGYDQIKNNFYKRNINCNFLSRLNQVSVLINREGTFYGQCSEVCGILHSSMPIVIQSVSIEKFLTWLEEQ